MTCSCSPCEYCADPACRSSVRDFAKRNGLPDPNERPAPAGMRRIVTPRPSAHPATHGHGDTDVARLRVALFKLAALVPVQVPGGLTDHEIAELLVSELTACLDVQIEAFSSLTPESG